MITFYAIAVSAASMRISNLEPKRDTSGAIVNGHDGTYRLIDGWWYYHAAEYGLCPEPPRHGCDGGGSLHGSCRQTCCFCQHACQCSLLRRVALAERHGRLCGRLVAGFDAAVARETRVEVARERSTI